MQQHNRCFVVMQRLSQHKCFGGRIVYVYIYIYLVPRWFRIEKILDLCIEQRNAHNAWWQVFLSKILILNSYKWYQNKINKWLIRARRHNDESYRINDKTCNISLFEIDHKPLVLLMIGFNLIRAFNLLNQCYSLNNAWKHVNTFVNIYLVPYFFYTFESIYSVNK